MNKIIPIEHKNQRVLTTQQLAEAYGTDDKKIRDNFTNNRHRYIPGKHYYKAEGEELQYLKNDTENFGAVGDRASSVYLWTEKGAWLHAKSLNTDKAWEAYELLIDDYYQVKQNAIDYSKLSPELQMVQHLLNSAAKLEQKVDRLTETTQHIKDIVINTPDNWREDINRMINKISIKVGQNKFQEIRTESYKLLEQRAHVDLKKRLSNLQLRLMQSGASKTAINNTHKIDVVEADPKLREIYSAIIKEYTIKYVA